MRFNLMIFVLGILFITAGYAHQMRPSCKKGIEVKYVPRNVYDEIMKSKPYSEEDTL